MKTILVPTDFSENALNALRYAAALSHQFKDTPEILLYHSYEVAAPATEVPVPLPADVEQLRRKSEEALDELKRFTETLVPPGMIIETITDERPLLQAINTISEWNRVSLIVMGISAKSSLQQFFIGSNAVSMARESHAPVLAVPLSAVYRPVQKVVFACDLRNVSLTTPIETIKHFTSFFGARLLILHAGHREHRHFDTEMVTEQSTLHELLNEEHPEFYYTEHEEATEGILQFAAEHEAGLIITIPRKYGFFEGLFHRSLTRKLASHTAIPLLLLPEKRN